MVMAKRFLSFLLIFAGFSLNAAAQERQWSLDASDEDAYLIFGVADSDDVGLSLWCPIRTGTVNIFVPETIAATRAGQEITMILTADGQTAEILGKAQENEDAGVPSVEGHIPADHPILTAMMKADRFHVKVAQDDQVFPLYDADVAGLLDLCRKS